eukprot:3323964-Amphidinium_carterae.1
MGSIKREILQEPPGLEGLAEPQASCVTAADALRGDGSHNEPTHGNATFRDVDGYCHVFRVLSASRGTEQHPGAGPDTTLGGIQDTLPVELSASPCGKVKGIKRTGVRRVDEPRLASPAVPGAHASQAGGQARQEGTL